MKATLHTYLPEVEEFQLDQREGTDDIFSEGKRQFVS